MKHTKIITSIILTTLLATGSMFAWTNITNVSDNDPLTSGLWNNLVNKINENGNKLNPITNSSGNIGIGSITPTNTLEVGDVGGHIGYAIAGTSDQYGLLLETGKNATPTEGAALYVRNLNNGGTVQEILYAQNNGNIGIGTTNPSQKLDVNGTARVDVLKGGKNSNFHIDAEDPSLGVYLNWHNTGNVFARNTLLASSDLRLKENITTLPNAIENIKKLRGVYFDWKDESRPGRQVGVIAQEIEAVFPELVREDSEGFKTVSYANLVGPLIEAVKEQQKQIDILEQKISILEQK